MEGQQVVPEDPNLKHLGGYVSGGDNATWYPELWKWLRDNLKIESVLDIGCGEGHSVKYFRDVLRIPTVVGIDGLLQGDPAIEVHDFTKGPWPSPSMLYDLIWCCEFVEHVPEEFMPNFLLAFTLGRFVAMTHAEPGQAGHHHVNCRTKEYWIGAMAAIGYQLNEVLTECSRLIALANKDPWNHWRRSGLIFTRHFPT